VTLNDDRSGTLILRVWLESGTNDLRGRLTTVDTSIGHEGADLTVGVASSVDGLVDAVRAWLDQFLEGGGPHPVDIGN
jgi:hypothetical protein